MKKLLLILMTLLTAQINARPTYEFVSIANSVGNLMNTFQTPAINSDGKVVFLAQLPGVGAAVIAGDGSSAAQVLASTANGFTPKGQPVLNTTHAVFGANEGALVLDSLFSVPLASGSVTPLFQNVDGMMGLASPNALIMSDGTVYFSISGTPNQAVNFHRGKLLRTTTTGGLPSTVVDASAIYSVQDPLGVVPTSGRLYFFAVQPSLVPSIHTTSINAGGGPGTRFFQPNRSINGAVSDTGILILSESLSINSSRIVRFSPSGKANTVADSTKFSISQFGVPAINAAGSVVFSGSAFKAGLFRHNVYRGGNPTLDKLFGTDTPLFGSRIITVETGRFAINDQGQIAFKYLLANGVSGVGVANPTTPPSPPLPAVVATLGQQVTGENSSTVYSSFGTPQVGVFAGKYKVNKLTTSALFGADGSVKIRTGLLGTTLLGSTLASVSSPCGDAVLAKLKTVPGSITSANNVVLLRSLASGIPTVVAQTGTVVPGLPSGVTIKSFGAIDGQGNTLFFLAKLKGTGIVVGRDMALCAALPDGNINVLVKKGDTVQGRTVSSLTTLTASSGIAAEGRWRMGNDHFGVLLGFSGSNQSMYRIPGTSTGPDDWTALIETGIITDGGGVLNGKRIAKINLASFGPDSAAALVTLAAESGVITKANDTAIVTRNIGASYVTLAREGATLLTDADSNPQVGVTIRSLSKVVVGANGSVAFVIGASNSSVGLGLAYSTNGSTWRLLANTGSPTPIGSTWSTFPLMVLPDEPGVGPVFTATLKPNAAEGITTANASGVWTLAADGSLRRLLAQGQSVSVGMSTKNIRSILTLTPSAGSAGAASTHDSTGTVSAVVQFTDGSKSLLRTVLP